MKWEQLSPLFFQKKMIKDLKTFNRNFTERIKIFTNIVKDFKDFEARFNKISSQKNRDFDVRDNNFEKDFSAFSVNLHKFSTEVYGEVQELRFACVKMFPKEELLTLKELACACLTFNKLINQFDRIFKNLDWQIQELNLNLKWGLVEVAKNDFSNLEKQFLSLNKEVRKYYV